MQPPPPSRSHICGFNRIINLRLIHVSLKWNTNSIIQKKNASYVAFTFTFRHDWGVAGSAVVAIVMLMLPQLSLLSHSVLIRSIRVKLHILKYKL